ncbi:TonB-dependent siderophore receptor [Thauera sp. Sel9]|uniref:TonB-dependent siderophore receptor n=1 Tax=Thauera sp. Sel9 TaxID=2974299 RepID=UPI0021E19A2E|nr:TonB-dependent receptor [Thauera sp. Sel9]MCV2217627.1 TonB-dependent receptor [Thauera sp. Sel9]
MQTRQPHPLRPLAVHLRIALLGLACIALLPAGPASAAEPATLAGAAQQHYALPAGPLSQALYHFAAQAGITLTFDAALTDGQHSAGLDGNYGAEAGLRKLLTGSGLEAVRGENGGYRLRSLPAVSMGDVRLAPVTVSAQPERSAITEGTGSFAVRAVSINKGEQALKDIPQSISVLTRKQLDEQGITDLRAAANNVTGMVGAKGVGPGMVLTARGFQIDAWQHDGVAIPRNTWALGNWGTEGMVFYDRLEVLRGASGLLQGTGSPGGAVNLVRKRGQVEKTVALTARAGSWDRHGLQVDAGGPLDDDGSLRGRVVLDEVRSHSFIDYVNDRTRSLYAALDYDVGLDTTLGLGVSHSDSHGRPMIRGLPRYPDGSDLHLPRSTFVGSWWNRMSIEQTTFHADLEHRFNADWKIKASALRMSEKNSSTHQRMHGLVAADGSGVSYADWVTDFDSTKLGFDAYVNGRFEALGRQNEVTLGANYSKYTSDDLWTRLFTPGGNIFAIDHHRPRPTADSLLAAGGMQNPSEYDVRQKGIYASWRVRLSEPLTAIVGARVSWYDYLYRNLSNGSPSVNTDSGEITPYAGFVYELTPQWSVYGSYTSVFEPQSERTAEGSVLDPIIGTNYELGIKGELLDGRVNASLAVFRYDHENRAVNDVASGFACSGWYCAKASGKVRSQGIEAEISGEVLSDLQLMAGYTYNTSRFMSDPVNQGKVFSTWTPRHMLRVWASYRLPGEWNQLTVGGGLTAQSHTLGYDRSFKVPGFTVANLRLGYQATPEVGLALNLNNVFDKRYWIPAYAQQDGNNDYGEPRNVMFTLKYTPRL